MLHQGQSTQAVADNFGITKQRVSQINQEYQETVGDDAYRDLQRTALEGLLGVVTDTIKNPGFVVSPGGRVVCEPYADGRTDRNGMPLPDPSRPLLDKALRLKAVEVGVRVHERLARAYGLDRVRQKEQDQSAEMNEFLQYVETTTAENALLRAQLAKLSPVIEAEVIEDHQS